ncbi:MAG TPA: PIN domain-containing protein [Bryobacteraceae bacterium]|nr:PIN domain-containing protein [Bryobacteraceae bacterium]
MNADKAFFDTNILVYSFSIGDPRREKALSLLLAGGVISVQALNEFVDVAVRKMKEPWSNVIFWIDTIQQLCESPAPLTMSVHRRGVELASLSGYRIYDSLMLAAAIEANCTIFYSEDMHHGHTLGDLTIRNPFKRAR